MLIPLHLVEYKHVKIRLKHFSFVVRNVSENFCHSSQVFRCMYTVFIAVHAMLGMNHMYQFQIMSERVKKENEWIKSEKVIIAIFPVFQIV